MSEHDNVNLERIDSVAVLTLDRPRKLNALTNAMRGSLINHLHLLTNDASVRVIVLTGAGDRAFCAGTDVSEFIGRSGSEQFELDLDPMRLFEVIERSPKPIVAMVNGFAFGGGCELALACDIRIGSDQAELGQLEIKFGLIPGGGGTQRLTRLVGRGQAMRLILTGDRISADEAWRIGLLDLLVPASELRVRALEIARRIATHSPLAIQLAKESIRSVDELSLSAGLRYEAALMAMCLDEGDAESEINRFINGREGRAEDQQDQ